MGDGKMAKKKDNPPFTLEWMENALRDAGLRVGDKVFVHSSLQDIASFRQLAKLPNTGMDIILEAFENILTEDGLMALPTFTSTFVDPGVGPTGKVWDKSETPSRVGSITDFAWRQPGFFRSDHPTHPVAARGKGAEAFVAGHRYDDDSTFGKTTPWGKLFRQEFKLLFLGTWFNTCTAVHLTEDWLDLPYMAPAVQALVKGEDGETREVTVTGSPWGNRDFYKRTGSKVVDRLWLKDRDLFRMVSHGRCVLLMTSFRDLVSTIIDYHYDEPLLLLNDPAREEFAARYAEATVEVMEKRTKGDWLEELE